jgi:Recombinase zinc beta ribbon domain
MGVPCPSQYQTSNGRFSEGRPVATGWRRASIALLLHTPAYWGKHAAYRWEALTVVEQDATTGQYHEYREQRLRQETDAQRVELPPEVYPPLVDAWVAEVAHQRLAQNKCQASKTGVNRQAMLRGGYVRCGYRGKPLYCASDPPSLPRYYCRSYREKQGGLCTTVCPGGSYTVRHDRLDAAVWQDIV